MALPLVAGIAIAAGAGAAGGGIFGSLFGSGIDEERKRIERAVKDYQAAVDARIKIYDQAESIADVVNKGSLNKVSDSGLMSTYVTDLNKAFKAPTSFNFRKESEDEYAA